MSSSIFCETFTRDSKIEVIEHLLSRVAFKALHELDFWVSPWGDINGCKARQQADWNGQFQEFLIQNGYQKRLRINSEFEAYSAVFCFCRASSQFPLPSVALQQHHTGSKVLIMS